MTFSIDKYTFYSSNNKVVALSSVAGKTVRGVAKCDPDDEFSLEAGKRLAAARCNEKIAHKRLKRAKSRMISAEQEYLIAKRRFEKMQTYFADSQALYAKAQNHSIKTLSELI
jgi:hypothetical protein